MPTTDWQFWVVSAIALVAAWRISMMLWKMVRPLFNKGTPPPRRASLTISAKPAKPE